MAQAYSEHRTRQKRRSGVARSTEGPDGGPEDSSKERNPAVVVDEASVDGAGADGVMRHKDCTLIRCNSGNILML